MNSLLFLFNLYLKSSLHVALAVTAFSWLTTIHLNTGISELLLVFIFCATVVSYNLTKYSAPLWNGDQPASVMLRGILAITMISIFGMVISLLYLPAGVIASAVLFGFMTLLYAVPVRGNGSNLRQVYGLKIVIIALVWTGVTVVMPLLGAGAEYLFRGDTILVLVQRFLFVIVLILPFDIRDLQNDHPSLGTVPQLIGIHHTRNAGILLLVAVVLTGVALWQPGSTAFLILVAVSGITAVLILRSMRHQSAYFASFWVEGIPVLWALLHLILG